MPSEAFAPDRSTQPVLYLVDGSGYIFRAFHALPPMTRPDGTPTNAVHGFTGMLTKALEDWGAEYLAVIFDASSQSFRNEIYDQYKAQRPDPPEELVPQFGLIREAVRAYNLPCIEMEGFEADDLIATYAKQAEKVGYEVVIVSSDKDLMQLVRPGVRMLDPMKDKQIGPDEVMEKFGVPPDKVVDVQALAGDSVDNVPGVPGIGVKTAAQLITEYGDLDTLLERSDQIKQPKRRQNLTEHAEMARISRDLVRLRDDAPVTDNVADFGVNPPDPDAIVGFLMRNALRTVLSRVTSRMLPDHGISAEAIAAAEASAREILSQEGGLDPKFAAADADPASKPGSGADEKPISQNTYTLITDAETLKAWVAEAEDTGIFAFDTETTSLDANQAELVGVSMAITPGEAAYVPLRHKGANGSGGAGELAFEEAPKQIPFDQAIEILRPVLEDDGVKKIGHNLKYDALVLAQPDNGGITLANIDDTMVLSYVLDGSRHGHGMDELSDLLLDHKTIKYAEVAGKGKDQVTFDQVGLDKALDYAAEDADITLRLHRRLKPRLVQDGMTTVYETLERPLIPVLVDMEQAGIKVDRQILSRMSGDFAQRLGVLESEIHELAGHPFKVSSPKQLGEVLFDEMGLPGGKKMKTGAWGTSSDVLEPLAAQGLDIAARVLDWRQLSKLKSTYADALVDDINPRTGRVHTSYAMTVANTGRLSSTDPNLQNIPIRTEEGRRIREAFVAEEGYVLLSVDYSQVELRLAAHIAGVETLKTAFREGQDIHAMTAAQVFGVPMEEMDGELRRKAKAINFGIIYGISGFGLANQLRIPQGEASAYIRQYLDRLPELKEWLDATKKSAKTNGFVETLFGRRIYLNSINDKLPARRAGAERQAINAPIQGSAADIIKRAMIRVPPALEQAGLNARMLLQVHDELLFEVPEDELDKTTQLVRETMEAAALPAVEISVPLVADAGHGRSWAEAH